MAKYISLVKYTGKGIENVKQSPTRLDDFKKLCESMGAKVEGFYLTMGRCDMLVILDAPDSATVAKIILATSSRGAISTETMQAFSEANIAKSSRKYPKVMAGTLFGMYKTSEAELGQGHMTLPRFRHPR